MATFAKSTFSHASYAAFRPTYPSALYNAVLNYHRGARKSVIDLGTGHGVVARALSKNFEHVLGTDPSPGMIAQAKDLTPTSSFPNVTYTSATAESTPSTVPPNSVDMVVAGQAAHWFDYPRLFPELARVLRPGGTLAFWGYTDIVFVDHPAATRVLHNYSYARNDPELLGDYWDRPGRSIVEGRLKEIRPPTELFADEQRIDYIPETKGVQSGEGTRLLHARLNMAQVRGYVGTWSAVHAWREAHQGVLAREKGGDGDVVDRMMDDMAEAEGWSKEAVEGGEGGMELEVEWGTGILLARKKED